MIQAPMLGVSTPEMAAAVSNEGGLGSLPVGGLSPDVTLQFIRKIKSLTEKPFAVNLFAHQIPAYTEDDFEPMRPLLLQLANKRGYDLAVADLANFTFYNHLDQIDILIEEEISLVSFTFGCLDPESIRALQQNACTLIGTATCVEEALFLQQQNIDMIVVQGIEAGRHRGTFIEDMLANWTPYNEFSLPFNYGYYWTPNGYYSKSSSLILALNQGNEVYTTFMYHTRLL